MWCLGIDDLAEVITNYQSRIEKDSIKGGDEPPRQDSAIKEQFKDLVYLSKNLGGTTSFYLPLPFPRETPKSDYVTDYYVGLETLAANLKTNLQRGLVPTDLQQRTSHFGTNRKDPPERTSFWVFFIGALDDFMLKLLLVSACINIGFEVGFAHDNEERKTGKYLSKQDTLTFSATLAAGISFIRKYYKI